MNEPRPPGSVPPPPAPVPPSPPSDGRISGLIAAVKGLTLSNVMVIALLAAILVPVYIVYRALDNEQLLDRFMSTYEEESNQQSGCSVRHVQERGGPDQWSVSSGFAFAGSDRWFVNVVLTHEPSGEEITSYCESLKLIADTMLERGRAAGEVLGGSVPGAETDGGRHQRIVPRTPQTEEAQ